MGFFQKKKSDTNSNILQFLNKIKQKVKLEQPRENIKNKD